MYDLHAIRRLRLRRGSRWPPLRLRKQAGSAEASFLPKAPSGCRRTVGRREVKTLGRKTGCAPCPNCGCTERHTPEGFTHVSLEKLNIQVPLTAEDTVQVSRRADALESVGVRPEPCVKCGFFWLFAAPR